VPIGVNRTWVKQTEKGTYPNTRRVFSVMRCNHCTDAPCVEICPVQALFVREDGIVDFDSNRCIGCKSCMQACPYDALYIDPETHTAAKCNYCAHRVDVGLEPACVNVCPEHAIISGDMHDPASEISMLLSREQVIVRKPEKATNPNLYYINGDQASLTPSTSDRSNSYIWSSQSTGVGHFAKFAEALANGKDLVEMAKRNQNNLASSLTYTPDSGPEKSVSVLMKEAKVRRVYDTPDKGILWGWEVSAYVWTKAIAAGAFLIPFIASQIGIWSLDDASSIIAASVSMVFLMLTGLLLVKDLDQPKRFVYVLLRPQWRSWLVRGGYAITLFGAFLALFIASVWLDWTILESISSWGAALSGIIVAIYTAFLFAQAKGRDFWQSPTLIFHMLAHSIMAGAAILSLANLFHDGFEQQFINTMMITGIIANLAILTAELSMTHPTEDSKRVAKMILKGRYQNLFWMGTIVMGNLLPLLVIFIGGNFAGATASILLLAGIYTTEKIWVEAPQRIPLT
jgi:Fe-S-cluster-containing dehydrogenase component/formate-dependent nitrite reductase membrane component NrfD